MFIRLIRGFVRYPLYASRLRCTRIQAGNQVSLVSRFIPLLKLLLGSALRLRYRQESSLFESCVLTTPVDWRCILDYAPGRTRFRPARSAFRSAYTSSPDLIFIVSNIHGRRPFHLFDRGYRYTCQKTRRD